jgi:hypothetical protein
MSGDLVVESVHQVPVPVHGHCDRAVPETGLDGLGMLAVGNEPSGVSVAEIVDATMRTYGIAHCLAPYPPKRASPEHLTSADRRFPDGGECAILLRKVGDLCEW